MAIGRGVKRRREEKAQGAGEEGVRREASVRREEKAQGAGRRGKRRREKTITKYISC